MRLSVLRLKSGCPAGWRPTRAFPHQSGRSRDSGTVLRCPAFGRAASGNHRATCPQPPPIRAGRHKTFEPLPDPMRTLSTASTFHFCFSWENERFPTGESYLHFVSPVLNGSDVLSQSQTFSRPGYARQPSRVVPVRTEEMSRRLNTEGAKLPHHVGLVGVAMFGRERGPCFRRTH